MKQLKLRQVCLFFIAFLPITKIFTLPSILAGTANEDMWISCAVISLLEVLTAVILLFYFSKTDKNIFSLLEENLPKPLLKSIYVLYFFYFLIKAIYPIYEQKTYTQLTFYETPQTIVVFLPFFLVSFYLCLKELRIFGRLADIFWVFSLIGITVIIALAGEDLDFSSVLPIGANGVNNILEGSKKCANWFGDCVYLLLFLGNFEKEKGYKKKIILSLSFSLFIVIFFMFAFYSIFSFIAFRQIYSLAEMSKYSTVVFNIGRFDYVAIILVLLSGVISLIIPIYFATLLLKKIFEFKNNFLPSLIVNAFYVILFIFFEEYFSFIKNSVINYLPPFFMLLSYVLPLLSIILIKKDEKIKEVKGEKL